MRYLIFGGTGSLGKKLIDRLLPQHQVAVYSRDEAKHWTIRNELAGGLLDARARDGLRFFVGDIRDAARVKSVIRQFVPQVVIVAAALKQVDTCELSPSESVMTNLLGTQNVIDAVNDLNNAQTSKVLFVSTDKACAPVNVYGMCKAISERIVVSQATTSPTQTKFICVRYGNVLESRGSIIPLFKYQAAHNEHLTVTEPTMTRFVMTLDDSVNLIVHALTSGTSGDTWIPKLPSMKIGDLADIFSKMTGKPIKIIGLRPGEKQHEDLINESESVRTVVMGNHYVIKPSTQPKLAGPRFTYSSNQVPLAREALESHLRDLGVIDASLDRFIGPSIEEIITNRK